MPFVSFEGIDGSGKSVQLDRLANRLEEQGKVVLRTKEPGGGALGGAVREIFTRNADPISLTEQLLLVSAARYDHVRSVVIPALDRGEWVLTDRFLDSTYALQVFETEVPLELFEATQSAVVGGLKPDLTFILDLPVETAEARRGHRGAADDPLEHHRDFDRIRRGFQKVAADQHDRCRLIQADRPEEEVEWLIWREVEKRLRTSAT